jgi:YqxM protein
MRGVIKIRNTRVKKAKKKNWIVVLTAQLLTIGYLFTVAAAFLTSDTEAYYNVNVLVTDTINAGTWEEIPDNSTLKLPNENIDQKSENSSVQTIEQQTLSVPTQENLDQTNKTQIEETVLEQPSETNPSNSNLIIEEVESTILQNVKGDLNEN